MKEIRITFLGESKRVDVHVTGEAAELLGHGFENVLESHGDGNKIEISTREELDELAGREQHQAASVQADSQSSQAAAE